MNFTNKFRFILKTPKKKFPLVEINGEFLEIPDAPPVLKRTSRGIDCDRCEPSNSIGLLCEFYPEINSDGLCSIKVFRDGIWHNVDWKINKSTNQIYYWVTSYFNPPHLYIENINRDYILCRPQFNIYTLYFILKLKTLGVRFRKKRVIKHNFNKLLAEKIISYNH